MTVTLDSPAVDTARRGTGNFAIGLVALIAMMTGASAPSPFYPVLQLELGFSSATLTGIFAVYAIALLATLLVAGSLSDHIGRRPVISVGFMLLALSMVAFWHADSVSMLMGARVVQGIASGLLLSALSAVVVDLEPTDRPGAAATFNSVSPMAGLAAGGLIAGAVLDHAASPLTVVFGALTVVYVVLSAAVWVLPETSARREGLRQSLKPRVGIPAVARPAFLRSTPALIAGWATGGLYLSLGAPLVAQGLGGSNHLEQGLVVTVLNGLGGIACYVARGASPRAMTIYGTTALALGTALTLAALASGSLVAFLLASAIVGTGFGTGFLGIMRSITPIVGPHERGELFAAVFVVSYLAFGIPVVIAGISAPYLGLAETTYVYGGVVIVLSAAAALLRTFRSSD